ncbi:MAG: DNA recombination protein RmuC [Parcubacteria group bacterium]|nr:DNA recombination protein RmuC [Parcubacteria group bacterium]
MNEAILLILGMAVGYALRNFLAKREREILQSAFQKSEQQLRETFQSLASESLRKNSEQFLLIAGQKLDSSTKDVSRDLMEKKSLIANLIEEMRKDLARNTEEMQKSEKQNIASFSALKEELTQYKSITSDLKSSTEDLKKVLSNNQMRGQFGEQIAENLLKMAGFVVGQDYVFNQKQEGSSTRPDFTIFLPDGTKINIDAKFPYKSLISLSESKDDMEKKRYLGLFIQDVKQKIKQVTTRDYISPQDKTVDFVIVFIPNEMIFSFIYDQLNEVWEEAMAKKVIFAGPFTFTALLRMIKQAYENFRYHKNLHNIVALIQKFSQEYQKYSDSVDALGKRIKATEEQYAVVSTTRDRMLNRVMDQIRNESGSIDEPQERNMISGQ